MLVHNGGDNNEGITRTIQMKRYHRSARSIINADYRKVGAIHFIKIGRLTFSFCLSRSYRPIGG